MKHFTYFDLLWNKHLLENLKVSIWIDEYYHEDEFYHNDELVKIEIQPHRHYEFLHDLDLKRDYLLYTYEKDDYYYEEYLEEQKKRKKLNEENYVFWLDYFEHWMISFSLVEKRQNIWYYEFDRTRNVWFIFIKKEENLSYSDAMKIAENVIQEYNSYINWRIYEYRIKDENDDFVDGCTGFYEEKHAENDAIDYAEWYLKNQWIDFSKVQIEE